MHEKMTPEERQLLRKLLATYRSLPDSPPNATMHQDRRCALSDRRQRHLFIANDRRSGVADRRHRLPVIPSLIDCLRRRMQLTTRHGSG